MAEKRQCGSYKQRVANLLADTLRGMSLDLVRIIVGYIASYPTATAHTPVALALVLGEKGEFGDSLWGIACGPDNCIWVSDGPNVLAFSAEGKFLRLISVSLPAYPQRDPVGVALGPDGELYIAPFWGGCIRICLPGSSLASRLGQVQFRGPKFLAVDHKHGLLYVTELHGARVQVLKLDGSFVRTIGGPGKANGQFTSPEGLAVNRSGELGVLDIAGRLQVFDDKGNFLRTFGSYGSYLGMLSFPVGLAVDSANNWVVADGRNHRIQVFAVDGTFITAFGANLSGLEHPMGVCVDGEDRIWVVDNRKRVYAFVFDPPR